MGLSKINGFNVILIILLLLLVVNVSAETTFFDNPNDAFIMGNFPTTAHGTTGETTDGGGCIYNWTCTSWSTCINKFQTRTCADINGCNDSVSKPSTNQSCTGYCTPAWYCTVWSSCVNNTQTRECGDTQYCGITEGKPIESQSCTAKPTAKNITPPTLPAKTPEEPKAPAIIPTPSTAIPLGLGVGLIAVIAISIVITAIILKKRKQN
jgi:hypothetical protein